MELEAYKKAKSLREKIDHVRWKKREIEKMRKRHNDDEFNLAHVISYEAICYNISRLEEDFKAI